MGGNRPKGHQPRNHSRYAEAMEFGVGIWRRGQFDAIDSEHSDYTECEKRAALLHGDVNGGPGRPFVMFVPVHIAKVEARQGRLERTDEFEERGLTKRTVSKR